MGKRTAQKDTIIDITSDSQVNSNFPYRWSPASLTFNIYIFLYLYITRITINNNAPHLKSPKNQKRRAALGRPAMTLLGVGVLELVCGRPTLALSSALVHQTKQLHESITLQNKNKNTKHLFLPIFYFFVIKHDREQTGKLYRWPQC